MSKNKKEIELKIGDKFTHILGLEVVFMEQKTLKDVAPEQDLGDRADNKVFTFGWMDTAKHLNTLYLFENQIERWLTRVE